MSLVVTVPEDTEQSVRELAAASGRSPEQTVLDAFSSYFPEMPPELLDEMRAWHAAADSDADAVNAANAITW